MGKALSGLCFVPVFALMAILLFSRIDRHAVDLPFSDQWYTLTPVLTGAGPLELFVCQYGPHRQGLGALLTKAVAAATDLNLRAESFAIGAVSCLACAVALLLTRRVRGRFAWSDAVIPLLFLTPLQWEAVTGVPNPAHGVVPLLLLIVLARAFSIRGRWRYPAVLGLEFALVFTGFGVFAGVAVVGILLLELIRDTRRRDARGVVHGCVASLCAGAIAGSFLLGYEFAPAVPEFRFPDPNWPRYPLLIARALANVVGVRGAAADGIGLVLLAAAVWTVTVQARALVRSSATEYSRPGTAVLLTTGFSLLFCANVAIGRMSLGVDAGMVSRYVPLLIPLFFGLYLQATQLPPRIRFPVLGLTLGLHVLGSVGSLEQTNAAAAAFHDTKLAWRDAFLDGGSIAAADAAARSSIHPEGLVDARERTDDLSRKLAFLETHRLSLFRDHAIRYPTDPRLVGTWRPAGWSGSEHDLLRADGTYRMGTRRPAETGRWRTAHGELQLRAAGSMSWQSLGDYRVSDSSVTLERSGLRWERD
ncbi:MAG: hypothetical protein H6836_06345 [Planctomycetes bacterium]|nr:hypothetical protein [Planctomycetota bacterium]